MNPIIKKRLAEFDEKFDAITMLCRDKKSSYYGKRILCGNYIKQFLQSSMESLLLSEEKLEKNLPCTANLFHLDTKEKLSTQILAL